MINQVTIGRTGLGQKDFQQTIDQISAKYEEAKAKFDTQYREAVDRMQAAPDSALKRAWQAAVKEKWGVDKAFSSLLNEVEPVRAWELKMSGDEERRLNAVVRSFTTLCQDLRTLNQGPAETPIDPVLAKNQHSLRRSLLSDVQAIREAVKAAGPNVKEIGQMSFAQLALIETQARIDAERILEQRAMFLGGLPATPTAGMTVMSVAAAAEALGNLLGDKGLSAAIERAAERVKGPDKAAFQRNLSALLSMAEVATTALDYSTTRSGGGVPESRVEYRHRQYDSWLLYASESRLDATHGRMIDLARDVAKSADPAGELEKRLVPTFLKEIGVPPDVSRNWKVTSGGVANALKHEMLLPLRALNETVDDILDRKRAHEHAGAIQKVITDVTQHVLEGDYREWRYESPKSKQQLASLSNRQRDQWKEGMSIESPAIGGGKLKTREEDDVELLWVTKIGGPSHGFDYNPHCLLPLIANGRTKAILVDDPRWPHNAAARCYLRVLNFEDGKPMLYLEPMQRDFPHRDKFDGRSEEVQARESGAVRLAQVQHAVDKAREMGLPLNLSASDRAFLEALKVPYQPEGRKIVIEPSAGVFEASDTMFVGHDFPQLERLVSQPTGPRVVVMPAQAKE